MQNCDKNNSCDGEKSDITTSNIDIFESEETMDNSELVEKLHLKKGDNKISTVLEEGISVNISDDKLQKYLDK